MDYKELTQVMEDLNRTMNYLEETYIENEGEVTDDTERMESQLIDLQALLTTEGADVLGAWLKAKEDRKKALKAEKDYITRQMAAIDRTIDYIKQLASHVMKAAGQDKVKGERGYSFAATTSVTTQVDKDVLKALYADTVEEAIRNAHVPAYVNVTLTASSTKANELGIVDGDEEMFITTEIPTVRFTKPKNSKE